MIRAFIFVLGALLGNIIFANKSRKAATELWDAFTPAKADLIAGFRHDIANSSSKNVYLKVANQGEAAADNVQVEIDGTDIEEHERFNRFRPGEVVEDLRLEPNGSITRHYTISLDTSLREHSVRITWKDPSGQGRYESTQSYIKPCS
ncbi:hypothetical protein [Salinibacter altiplanensis]|uniref:hypothetical protein n=1 Tax=Salinibacter altiplanensis TaxID=1803181 RepID=UPI00131A4792|nr:hypothetical protein [Salinibacter altiplanensis]